MSAFFKKKKDMKINQRDIVNVEFVFPDGQVKKVLLYFPAIQFQH
jgi:hypothetical protein